MPTARLITVGSSDAMESVEGNDSLYTLISQATGKEPIVLGDKPIQWIQLLLALEQPGGGLVMGGWCRVLVQHGWGWPSPKGVSVLFASKWFWLTDLCLISDNHWMWSLAGNVVDGIPEVCHSLLMIIKC
nr:uncharacterized protein LOC109173008 isoform X1 [Ipomoea trifida]